MKEIDKTIVLISCVAKKMDGEHEAYKLYSPSTLFKAHWNYSLGCLKKDPKSEIFIISALHGVISPFKKIKKYDVTLKTMNKIKRKEWADKVILQLNNKFDLNKTEFIILAGKDYYENLIKLLPKYKLIPETPLPIGKRVQWFNKEINKCKGR